MSPRAKSLREKVENLDDGVFEHAVENEIRERLAAFASGIARFRDASRPAPPPPLDAVWSEGTTTLLHAPADGRPIILIPSLINRARILDLTETRSLTRHLARAGIDTYLVDWGSPGEVEKSFSFDDYVARLVRIRNEVTQRTGQAPVLIGYCMGGLMALALANDDPAKSAGLALLATPWDFHAGAPAQTAMLRASMPAIESLIGYMGILPVDVLQAMFAGLDPGATVRKFRAFAGLGAVGERAREFVALEDWLNDGVPLVGPVALECLNGWYLDNLPGLNAWHIGGKAVDPAGIAVPSLAMIPANDIIVPPAGARPLADRLPHCKTIDVDAGHIGMVAGSRAEAVLYRPLSAWICALQ